MARMVLFLQMTAVMISRPVPENPIVAVSMSTYVTKYASIVYTSIK